MILPLGGRGRAFDSLLSPFAKRAVHFIERHVDLHVQGYMYMLRMSKTELYSQRYGWFLICMTLNFACRDAVSTFSTVYYMICTSALDATALQTSLVSMCKDKKHFLHCPKIKTT